MEEFDDILLTQFVENLEKEWNISSEFQGDIDDFQLSQALEEYEIDKHDRKFR